MKKQFSIFVICIIMSSFPILCNAAQYNPRQLGILDGWSGSGAYDINNNDIVLGWSGDATSLVSTLWTDPNDVEQISGPEGPFSVRRINNNGYTVGYMVDSSTGNIRATVRDPLGNIIQKQVGSYAYSINDSLTVVGTLGYNAYVWKADGTTVDLGGDTDHNVTGIEINNSGTVAWSYQPIYQTGARRSFMWSDRSGPVELASLDQTFGTQVMDINGHGQIVGYSGDHAVVWDASGNIIRDLGVGKAYGINDLGQIVGESNNQAVLWNPEESIVDLGFGGSSIAYAINNNSLIVGSVWSSDPDTNVMAVLWEPVPEPSAFAALACGLVGIGIRRRFFG